MAAYLRERKLRGDPRIRIFSELPANKKFDTPVTTAEEIIRQGFPLSISERLDRVLKNLHRLSEHLGAEVCLDLEMDGPVLFAENEDAFNFTIETLKEAGWVKAGPIWEERGLVLTASGLNRIAELERTIAGKESKQAFVAMWFDNSLDKAWEDGFASACDAVGYKALRMDLKEHNQKICDAIIAEIRKSRFLVADFTGHRGGVYFEAGYALGLGIPVIWTCREDELGSTHFDTRQYNHIVWKDEKDLFEKLKRRIEATIPA
ncbi:MAG TPA: hypothetical protein VLA99_08055 [Nitrospiraceae bacterium]|nr:hypothetical protein [Nitrospiraceae bacterium]